MTAVKKKIATKKPNVKGQTARMGDPVDAYVGARVRCRRNVLGISQEILAEKLGLTFQQIQKYERGANRVAASRLYQLAQIFSVEPNYFFEGYEESAPDKAYANAAVNVGEFDWLEADDGDLMERKETIELVRTYYSVQDPALRKNFVTMLKTLTSSQAT